MDDIQSRDDHQDDKEDSMGAKYLKVVNFVSFLDLAIYTVELSFFEHRRKIKIFFSKNFETSFLIEKSNF